jgi:hypothetical protein
VAGGRPHSKTIKKGNTKSEKLKKKKFAQIKTIKN